MDRSAHDAVMQIVGVSAAIAPLLVVAVAMAIASRRRRAAERAEPSNPPTT